MKTTVLAACAALMATTAAADTFTKYGDVEGWNVYVDIERKSCIVESIDANENVVQMGLTADRGVGYLGVFTKADTGIVRNETDEVIILIGENIYVGEARGMRGNITKGYSGGYVLSDDPQFATDIAQQYEMVVFPETQDAFVINLDGTKKALEMARECNAAQIEG